MLLIDSTWVVSATFCYLLDDDIWLAVTWLDLPQEDHTGTPIKYPQPEHLIRPLKLCPVQLHLRFLQEKNVSRLLGVCLAKERNGTPSKSRNYPLASSEKYS